MLLTKPLADFTFLEGYHEPTLCFLHENKRTWVGRLAGMLTHAHVCSRMLTYAHACSRMLTYAHGCSRMLTDAVGWLAVLHHTKSITTISLNISQKRSVRVSSMGHSRMSHDCR